MTDIRRELITEAEFDALVTSHVKELIEHTRFLLEVSHAYITMTQELANRNRGCLEETRRIRELTLQIVKRPVSL